MSGLLNPSRFAGGGGGGGPGGFAGAVLALSPLFYWKMSEATGTFTLVDASANGRDGTYWGAAQSETGLLASDPTNLATSSSGRIASGAWMPSTDITLMTLVKSASNSGNQGILSRFSSNNDWLMWKNVNGNGEWAVRFYNAAGSSVDLREAGSGASGQQRFLVATYTSGDAKLYANGSVVDSSSALTGNIRNASESIEVGGYQGGAFDFNGTQDETAVFDYALSGAQIAALYAAI